MGEDERENALDGVEMVYEMPIVDDGDGIRRVNWDADNGGIGTYMPYRQETLTAEDAARILRGQWDEEWDQGVGIGRPREQHLIVDDWGTVEENRVVVDTNERMLVLETDVDCEFSEIRISCAMTDSSSRSKPDDPMVYVELRFLTSAPFVGLHRQTILNANIKKVCVYNTTPNKDIADAIEYDNYDWYGIDVDECSAVGHPGDKFYNITLYGKGTAGVARTTIDYACSSASQNTEPSIDWDDVFQTND